MHFDLDEAASFLGHNHPTPSQKIKYKTASLHYIFLNYCTQGQQRSTSLYIQTLKKKKLLSRSVKETYVFVPSVFIFILKCVPFHRVMQATDATQMDLRGYF